MTPCLKERRDLYGNVYNLSLTSQIILFTVGRLREAAVLLRALHLTSLIAILAQSDNQLVARAGCIEVFDNSDAKLHEHLGATIAFITSEAGRFLFADGERPVHAGDVLYIPRAYTTSVSCTWGHDHD